MNPRWPDWPQSIWDASLGTFGYLVVGGILFLALAAVVAPTTWAAARITRASQPHSIVGKTLTFLFLVHACGLLANFAFVLLLENRWYYSSDPLLGFFPFFPSIDLGYGKLINGTTLPQFYSAWAVAAIGTWGVAALAARRLNVKRFARAV